MAVESMRSPPHGDHGDHGHHGNRPGGFPSGSESSKGFLKKIENIVHVGGRGRGE